MKRLALALALVGCTSASKPAPVSSAARAADFTLTDTDGNSVALHDLLKKGPVILAFFPKAFTAG